MAQVVIFAPVGEDVSAGEEALKAAGHEVEVVEATAPNLLHMAIGMIDGGTDATTASEPITEPTEEPAPADTAPADDPLADAPPEEPPKTEAVSLAVSIDGECLPAYIDPTAKFPLLRAASFSLNEHSKIEYSINESVFSIWKDTGTLMELKVEGFASKQIRAQVLPSASSAFLVLDEATAKLFGLV